MSKIKTPSMQERLTEALRERDECSKTCLDLIDSFVGLITRFKAICIAHAVVDDEIMAELSVRRERDAIRRARKGK